MAVPTWAGLPVNVTCKDTQSNFTTDILVAVLELVCVPAVMVVANAVLAPLTRMVNVVVEPAAAFAPSFTVKFDKAPGRAIGH